MNELLISCIVFLFGVMLITLGETNIKKVVKLNKMIIFVLPLIHVTWEKQNRSKLVVLHIVI